MGDKPLIFSAPMVRALLAGRKTQTRRLCRVQPPNEPGWNVADQDEDGVMWLSQKGTHCACRLPIAPGDRLYVREAFSYETLDVDRNGFMPPWYWADGNPVSGDFTRPKPSIHMPRWASRITLTVTDVRVQRLQDISNDDALDEGCECDSDGWRDYQHPSTQCCATGKDSYRTLWNSLHGPDAWSENPWVVAYTFTVQRGNIDAVKP